MPYLNPLENQKDVEDYHKLELKKCLTLKHLIIR